jgi:hypothetical protein
MSNHLLGAVPRYSAAQLDNALRALKDASFACGEWDRNESDESFEVVYARANRAEARVWRLLGLQKPKRCVKCGRVLRKAWLPDNEPERCARHADS